MIGERQPPKPGTTDHDRGGFLATVRAVLWAFFGVRRGAEYEKDVARLNPVHVIIAGIVGAALFVIVLVMIARGAAG